MEINIYRANNNLYIQVKGRIILDICDHFRNSAIPLIDKGINQVYLDLSSVDFIDSAGLGVMVGLKSTSNKNKARLVLVSPSIGVSDILNVSKLDSIFDIITGSEAELLKQSLAMAEYLIKNITADEQIRSRAVVVGREPAVKEEPPPGKAVPASGATKKTSSTPVSGSRPESPPIGIPSAGKSIKEQVDEHCRKAVELMRQGDYEKAVEKYLDALKSDPEYLPAYNNLAIVYEKRPAWRGKAIETWEKVLEHSQAIGDQKHIDRAQKHLSSLKTSF